MTTRRSRRYLRATLRVGWRTAAVLLASAFLLPFALFGLYFGVLAVPDCFGRGGLFLMCFVLIFGGGGFALLRMALQMLTHYFGRRPGPDPVWEWPSEIVAREEQARRDAKRGIELIAAAAPGGRGTEPEAGAAPEGTGTEPSAGGERMRARAEPAPGRPHPRERA